jgi:hypothetical protein
MVGCGSAGEALTLSVNTRFAVLPLAIRRFAMNPKNMLKS